MLSETSMGMVSTGQHGRAVALLGSPALERLICGDRTVDSPVTSGDAGSGARFRLRPRMGPARRARRARDGWFRLEMSQPGTDSSALVLVRW